MEVASMKDSLMEVASMRDSLKTCDEAISQHDREAQVLMLRSLGTQPLATSDH
jgi:hypothetical protein